MRNKDKVNQKDKIKQIKKVSRKYSILPVHAKNVSAYSLSIFNQTEDLHSLGNEERYWLESASILHDIGKDQRERGHHKISMENIFDDRDLPFSASESNIIGNIARYHRGSEPKLKHKSFAALASTDRRKVKILSSILRIADSLDAKHVSIIKKIELDVMEDKIIVNCYSPSNVLMKRRGIGTKFEKKKGMFEKEFGKKIRIRWINFNR